MIQWKAVCSPEPLCHSKSKELRNGRQFDLPATGRKISPMRARGAVLVVVCAGVAFAGAHLARAQEATSANLPDQFQTGEMINIQKSKKKAESSSPAPATASKQNTAPAPEQTSPAEELPTILATEEKKVEPSRSTASMQPSQKPATPTEQAPAAEESEPAVLPVERKSQPKKRPRPAVQPEAASISAPTTAIQARRKAWRRPVMMKGEAPGMITFQNSAFSSAPSTLRR